MAHGQLVARHGGGVHSAVGRLESIPSTVYDASRIDGASAWQTFLYIKIPMIRYSLLLTVLMSTFGTP